ncbi:MAG: hypothetical protein ACK44V_00715, partial [Burkholderiales bacterium]
MGLISESAGVIASGAFLAAEGDKVTDLARASSFAEYRVIRRNGSVVGFEPGKIGVALTKAFIAVNG